MTNTDVKTFYYELIIFEKDNPKPKKVRIKVDNAGIFRFNLMEGIGNEIYLTGTTSQPYEAPFMAQYNETTDELIATSFVFFRRPLELLKLYRSEGERNKIDRMEKGIDKGNREWYESNLEVRKLFFAPNGSTKIITEVDYFSGAGAYSRSNDIYVLSISSDHKLEWMRKLPKAQKNQDFSLPVPAADLSMNAYITGNDLHIFYLDNPANFNLAETSVPEICKEGKSNNLIGVHIDVNGNVKKYDLGNTDQFESDFFIKNFIDGGNRNLIYTQQKRKKNTVFSIHIIE